MDQQDALDHAPESYHWGDLEHYRMVDFPNLEEGKYYYFKRGRFPYDFIVLIHDKFNNRVKCEGIYWRLGPLMRQNAEYKSQWGPVPYIHDFDVSLADMNDQAPLGQRKFYVYDEDVVMEGVMEGGMRRGSLLGKKVYGSYKDGSDIYKDRTGYYIVQWNKRIMRPYKKYIKGFKPNRSSKTRKIHKKRGGGLIEDIHARLDDPSYILPAGTVGTVGAEEPIIVPNVVKMPVASRTTPPFFRKSRKANKKRSTRRRRRRASPSSYRRR